MVEEVHGCYMEEDIHGSNREEESHRRQSANGRLGAEAACMPGCLVLRAPGSSCGIEDYRTSSDDGCFRYLAFRAIYRDEARRMDSSGRSYDLHDRHHHSEYGTSC